MNIDRRDMKIIMDHFRGQVWFKDDLAAFQKERDERTRIANAMNEYEDFWRGIKPKHQRIIKAQIRTMLQKGMSKQEIIDNLTIPRGE